MDKKPTKKTPAKKAEKKVAFLVDKMKKPMPKTKKCPKCGSTKPLASFGTRKTKHVRADKIVVIKRPQSWCGACRKRNKAATKKPSTAKKLAPQAAKKVVKASAAKPSLKELVNGKGPAVAAAVAAKADAVF